MYRAFYKCFDKGFLGAFVIKFVLNAHAIYDIILLLSTK